MIKLHGLRERTVAFAKLCWFVWFSLAVIFCLDPTSGLVSYAALAALSLSVFLITMSPRAAINILPFPMLLGHTVSYVVPGVGNFNIGDLYSIFLVILTVFMLRKHRIFKMKRSVLIVLGLLVAGILASADVAASVAGASKIFQFAALVWMTGILHRSAEDQHDLLLNWVGVVTVCALMMLWFWLLLRPSFLLDWANGRDFDTVADFQRDDVLFRATFFYANFFVPLGLSVVMALRMLLSRERISRLTAFGLVFSMVINGFALILNNTRAIILPVFAVSSILLLSYFWRLIFNGSAKVIIFIASVVLIGCAVAMTASVVDESQVSALRDRSGDTSSVDMRLNLWAGSMAKAAADPVRLLLVGWGPQATARQGSDEMKALRTGVEGQTEGAFDSTLVGFLIEYGLILYVLMIAYLISWSRSAYFSWRIKGSAYAGTLFILGFVVFFAHVFQQFGFSAPALMVLQLLSFKHDGANAPLQHREPQVS